MKGLTVDLATGEMEVRDLTDDERADVEARVAQEAIDRDNMPKTQSEQIADLMERVNAISAVPVVAEALVDTTILEQDSVRKRT